MSRARVCLVALSAVLMLVLLALYSLLHSSPPRTKIVAKYQKPAAVTEAIREHTELTSDEDYRLSDNKVIGKEAVRQRGGSARQRQHHKQQDYVIDSDEENDVEFEKKPTEDNVTSQEDGSQGVRLGENDVLEEQRRQLVERDELEQLKQQLLEEKKKLEEEKAELNTEKEKVLEWKESEYKSVQQQQDRLQEQQRRLDHDKQLLQEKYEKHNKPEPTEAGQPIIGGMRLSNVFSKQELEEMAPADPKWFNGMSSDSVRRRFPGITFLPEYRQEAFVTPASDGRNRTIDDVSEYEAEERFYNLVTRYHVNCASMMRMGNTGDGGWDICVSAPYEPKSDCLVYSFGINNDFTFDDAMAAQFDCKVHAFDPSMGQGDHKHSEAVWFYQLGLGAANTVNAEGWRLETLGSILSKAGHLDHTLEVLKIDIEYNEWTCFRTMLKEGVLRNVKQLVFEIHTSEVYVINRPSRKEDFEAQYNILLALEEAGFRRYHYHYNPYGKYLSMRSGKQRTCCYELSYINIAFLNSEGDEEQQQ